MWVLLTRIAPAAAVLALATMGCGGTDTGKEVETPATEATSSTVTEAASSGDSVAVADDIRATERKRLAALVKGNVEAAGKFHADDFELITPTGDTLSKDEYLEALSSGQLDYLSWEPVSPIEVRVYGDAAVIRYRSEIGLAGSFGATSPTWHTDVYEKRDGQWQIVWSHASGAGAA